MILFLIMTMAFAKELPGEELYVAPSIVETKTAEANVISTQTSSKPKLLKRATPLVQSSSNIPSEYLASAGRQSTASELIQPPKGASELFRGLRIGDNLKLNIDHSVIAFSDEKSPVVAYAHAGSLKGYKFIGESYLEPNTKRIFINFTRLIQGHQMFNFKGVGVATNGQPGLIGEYHSREAEYFTGDFIASFAAGYFDGLIPRKTNAFGQLEMDNSVDSAVKKGLASGALSTADRFREKLKKVPEFSEIKGPFEIQLLVLEQAKTNQ